VRNAFHPLIGSWGPPARLVGHRLTVQITRSASSTTGLFCSSFCVEKRNWSPIGHCSPPHTPAGCADGFLPVPDDMPESSPHSVNEVQLWRKENA
jgi:hypothetical protein